MNIVPTPKAVQPLTKIGATSITSGGGGGPSQEEEEQSLQNTCLKNPMRHSTSSHVVIVPNAQAVASNPVQSKHTLKMFQQQHKRQ